MRSEHVNYFSGVEKRSLLGLFFLHTEIKRNHSCQVWTIWRFTHQIDVLITQKFRCFSRCVKARMVVVKSEKSSSIGFQLLLDSANSEILLQSATRFITYHDI